MQSSDLEANKNLFVRLFNYAKVFGFLICAIFFWFLFGWLADYSFPFGQALELILACFQGRISSKVNDLQQQLHKVDVVSQPNNKKQLRKLNTLESQAWLYKGILEKFGEDPSTNHEKISRSIEALEYKRKEILSELEPRRPLKYRILAGIQDSARDVFSSQAEKDYEQLQKIITNLVLFTKSRQPSQIILSELTSKIAIEIANHSTQISPYRLRLAHKIDDLINTLSDKLVFSSDNSTSDKEYQSIIRELRSQLNLLAQEFNKLLVTKRDDENQLNRQIQEIYSLTQNISGLYQEISNRDEHINSLKINVQTLQELIQEKNFEIQVFSNLLEKLEREAQNSDELSRENQSHISQLEMQISKLDIQRRDYQKRIDDLSAYIRDRDAEAINLKDEIRNLNTQKSDVDRKNLALHERYNYQQELITNLNQKLDETVSRLNELRTQKYTRGPATEDKISEEEYKEITNQDEYTYVRGHHRKKSGTWVEPYYRRKRI